MAARKTDGDFDRARRRRYGQNFLVDPGTKRRLVEQFSPAEDETIVEIGPGEGALTSPLAESGARIHAIEVDPVLAARLETAFADRPRVTVECADALDVDWPALAVTLGSRLRLFGNLPYNVGTAIVRRVLAADVVSDAQFMLQREAVDRLLSPHGVKSYGALSVIRALRAAGKRIGVVSPGVFRPRPKVESAVLRLEPWGDPPLPAAEIDAVEAWLHRGFRHRRKTLAGNLQPYADETRELLERHGLARDARAEMLPPLVWLELARRLGELGAERNAPG